MRQDRDRQPGSAEKTVRDIRCATRRRFSAEDKIRIVLEGLRGEDSIAELCRKEGINQWLRQYNHVRPHQALNMRPPVPETLITNGIELGGETQKVPPSTKQKRQPHTLRAAESQSSLHCDMFPTRNHLIS